MAAEARNAGEVCSEEDLINEVEKYPWLWNARRLDYKDSVKRANSWHAHWDRYLLMEAYYTEMEDMDEATEPDNRHGVHQRIQVTPETSSKQTQTNPVVVAPRCSSPNHVPQAQLGWTLPDGQKQLLASPSQPLVPPEPPQPPEPPTVVEKAHGQADLEDVDGDSLTELQLKHVEADVSYRPSDASFRMMLSDNSLRTVPPAVPAAGSRGTGQQPDDKDRGDQLQVAANTRADRVPYPFRGYTVSETNSAAPEADAQPDVNAVYCDVCGGLVVLEQQHMLSLNYCAQRVPGVKAVLARERRDPEFAARLGAAMPAAIGAAAPQVSGDLMDL
ncbi:hypothetical protein ISCGN_010651 [Ixodes scapularis]